MRGLILLQCSAGAWDSLEVKNYCLHFSGGPLGEGLPIPRLVVGLPRGIPTQQENLAMSKGGEEMPTCASLAAVPRVLLDHSCSQFLGLCFLPLRRQGSFGLPQPAFLPAPTHWEQSTAWPESKRGASGWVNSLSGFIPCTSKYVL